MSWTARKEVRSAIIGKCYAQVRRMAVPGMSRRVYFWAVVSKRGTVKKQGSVAKKKAGDRRTYYQIAMEEAEKCALSLSGKRKNPAFSATYWTPSERMKAARAARAAIEKTTKGGIRPSAKKARPNSSRKKPFFPDVAVRDYSLYLGSMIIDGQKYDLGVYEEPPRTRTSPISLYASYSIAYGPEDNEYISGYMFALRPPIYDRKNDRYVDNQGRILTGYRTRKELFEPNPTRMKVKIETINRYLDYLESLPASSLTWSQKKILELNKDEHNDLRYVPVSERARALSYLTTDLAAKGKKRPSARKNAAKMVKVFDGDYEGVVEVPADSIRWFPTVGMTRNKRLKVGPTRWKKAKNAGYMETSYEEKWRADRRAQADIDGGAYGPYRGEFPTTDGGDPRTNAGFARVRRIMMGQVPSIKTVGILTAENPQAKKLSAKQNRVRNQRLVRGLREMGYGPIPLKGMYGIKETSYLVPNITRKDTTDAGKAFDQESVIWASRKRSGRNAYMNWQFIKGNKTIQTRDLSMSGRDIQGREDFFSEKKGRKFAIPFYDERFEPRKFHRERIAQLKRIAAKRKNPTRASYKPMVKVVGERSNPGLTMSEIKLAIKAEKAAVKKIDQKMKKR